MGEYRYTCTSNMMYWFVMRLQDMYMYSVPVRVFTVMKMFCLLTISVLIYRWSSEHIMMRVCCFTSLMLDRQSMLLCSSLEENSRFHMITEAVRPTSQVLLQMWMMGNGTQSVDFIFAYELYYVFPDVIVRALKAINKHEQGYYMYILYMYLCMALTWL